MLIKEKDGNTMSKVALVTDSTAYIPKEYLEEYDIRVAHAVVIWEGEDMLDGVDIQPKEFYERLQISKEMPTSSQATTREFKEIFEELHSEDRDILCIVISSKFSGTWNSVKQAKEMLGGIRVEAIDSLTSSMGMGWPIIKAARAAARGASVEECKKIAEEALDNSGILLMVDTLKFLHRGGRIGGAQWFLGSALNLKPLLEVVNGTFEGLERVRTRGKALNRLVDLTVERIGGRKPVYLAAVHTNAHDVAAQLLEKASGILDPVESMVADVSPAVGVHMGPGAVGLAFLAGYE
jgi:DegV family protein with EDD domain